MEGDALDIGLAGQVGGGPALHDTFLDAAEEGFTLGPGEARIGPGIDVINRKVKSLENEKGRFVEGARRALAKGKARFLETADGKTQHIANGNQVVGMDFHEENP